MATPSYYSPGQYTPTGGFGAPSTSQQTYNPINNTAFSALNNYNQNASDMNNWLAQMIASNNAAAKQSSDARAQQLQNQQNTAAAAAPASGALQGASMGSIFGPWGALAGSIIGTGAGAVKDYNNNKNLGQTVLDVLNPVNMFNALTGQGGSAASGAQAAQTAGALSKSMSSQAPASVANVPGLNAGMQSGGGGTGYNATPGMPGQGSVQGFGYQGNNTFNQTPAPGGGQQNQWYMDSSGTWQPSMSNPSYNG